MMFADRQTQDQRAKLVFNFIQSWGIAAAFGDIPHAHDDPQPTRIPPTELVMRACEIVDAAWNELKHRGWIIELPSIAKTLSDE